MLIYANTLVYINISIRAVYAQFLKALTMLRKAKWGSPNRSSRTIIMCCCQQTKLSINVSRLHQKAKLFFQKEIQLRERIICVCFLNARFKTVLEILKVVIFSVKYISTTTTFHLYIFLCLFYIMYFCMVIIFDYYFLCVLIIMLVM